MSKIIALALTLLLTVLVFAAPVEAQKVKATQYQVSIKMNEATVKALQDGKFSLYGYKALAGSDGGAPTVWFSIPADRLTAKTTITWQEEYQAYVSDTAIDNGVTIHSSNDHAIDLGQTWEVERTGFGPVVDGKAGWIGVHNMSERAWTTGISQKVNGQFSILAAFPLFGNQLDLMQPIQKVLLLFSTQKINTGTVNFQALSKSLLIDLTGVDARAVDFNINSSWSCGGQAWCRAFPAGADIRSLLIDSSQSRFDPVALNDTAGKPEGACFASKRCRGDNLGTFEQNKCYSKSVGGKSWKAASGNCYDK